MVEVHMPEHSSSPAEAPAKHVGHVPAGALRLGPLDVECTGRVDIAEAFTAESPEELGAGLVEFADCEFDWELTGDECVYVLEGELEVLSDEGHLTASPGDVLRLRRGATVTYRVRGICRVFYALRPGSTVTAPLTGGGGGDD